ncbi:type IV inositol polyphosphate 5-phosphatase 9-like [Carex rostrata]
MAHNQRDEVNWPRLVANKLFKRPMSNNSFVADFPSCDKVISDDQQTVKQPQESKRDPLTYKLFASTWNVGGIVPPDDLNLEDWLDTRNNSHDIYVLGFQEIVPLSAKNILGPEKSKVTMKWNSLIRATLNKSLSNSPKEQEPKGGERQKVHPVKDASSFVQDFQCIISKQMVGILVSVWVRGDLCRYIRRTSISCVGCGILGCLGNKGAVSVRFWLHETTFCFVCCHLASGGKERDEGCRNSDTLEILSRTTFPRGHFLNLPQKILDHDRVVLLGDLNYRISLPESRTRSLVQQKEWKTLLENDQLRGEVSSGRALKEWKEGTITFSPTYKYFPNSDTYYDCIQGQKGKKLRAPAWCDRILWTGKGFKQIYYDRWESKLSDHRPVRALFSVDVDALRNLNSLRSFFLSERYDKNIVISHGEVFTKNDYKRSATFAESI